MVAEAGWGWPRRSGQHRMVCRGCRAGQLSVGVQRQAGAREGHRQPCVDLSCHAFRVPWNAQQLHSSKLNPPRPAGPQLALTAPCTAPDSLLPLGPPLNSHTQAVPALHRATLLMQLVELLRWHLQRHLLCQHDRKPWASSWRQSHSHAGSLPTERAGPGGGGAQNTCLAELSRRMRSPTNITCSNQRLGPLDLARDGQSGPRVTCGAVSLSGNERTKCYAVHFPAHPPACALWPAAVGWRG